jgi:endonuclease/exonuclease/phosphatase (EEP) superfamily protein YafD
MRTWPERRVAQLVRLQDGTCVVNFHGSARVALAEEELRRLWAFAEAWSGNLPLVFGGDLNLRSPWTPAGAHHLAQRDVDHIFARGLARSGEARRLERRVTLTDGPTVELSDHPPLLVSAELGG